MENKKIICIVDHGSGNITSINNILESLNVHYRLASNRTEFAGVTHVIIPGVGCFATAMKRLKETGIDKVINVGAREGLPILGICLGMQLLFEYSEEGNIEGLGLFEGRIVKKVPSNIALHKVPHVGWQSVERKNDSHLLKGIADDDLLFYFANSYALESGHHRFIKSTYEFDQYYAATIEKRNLFGTQFHPEKSGKIGKKLIRNFINIKS